MYVNVGCGRYSVLVRSSRIVDYRYILDDLPAHLQRQPNSNARFQASLFTHQGVRRFYTLLRDIAASDGAQIDVGASLVLKDLFRMRVAAEGPAALTRLS
jgi:hypothetical protein